MEHVAATVTIKLMKSSPVAKHYFWSKCSNGQDVLIKDIVYELVHQILKNRMFDPRYAKMIKCSEKLAIVFGVPGFHISQFA